MSRAPAHSLPAQPVISVAPLMSLTHGRRMHEPLQSHL
jgi:hypothetical protein